MAIGDFQRRVQRDERRRTAPDHLIAQWEKDLKEVARRVQEKFGTTMSAEERQNWKKDIRERNNLIYKLRFFGGGTLDKIGGLAGLSRTRIKQISVKRYRQEERRWENFSLKYPKSKILDPDEMPSPSGEWTPDDNGQEDRPA